MAQQCTGPVPSIPRIPHRCAATRGCTACRSGVGRPRRGRRRQHHPPCHVPIAPPPPPHERRCSTFWPPSHGGSPQSTPPPCARYAPRAAGPPHPRRLSSVRSAGGGCVAWGSGESDVHRPWDCTQESWPTPGTLPNPRTRLTAEVDLKSGTAGAAQRMPQAAEEHGGGVRRVDADAEPLQGGDADNAVQTAGAERRRLRHVCDGHVTAARALPACQRQHGRAEVQTHPTSTDLGQLHATQA